jgi:hypothetical protein
MWKLKFCVWAVLGVLVAVATFQRPILLAGFLAGSALLFIRVGTTRFRGTVLGIGLCWYSAMCVSLATEALTQVPGIDSHALISDCSRGVSVVLAIVACAFTFVGLWRWKYDEVQDTRRS